MRIISVRGVSTPDERQWLERAERVHRQLRPQLPVDYAGKMSRVFAGGAQMLLAVTDDDPKVLGVAVWRVHENTADGVKLYVDDLVTDEASRSAGVGQTLIAEIDVRARQSGADVVVLDSGTQRTRAHKFYFREGFVIRGFNFLRKL